MAEPNALVAERMAKIESLRREKAEPYAYSYRKDSSCAGILEKYKSIDREEHARAKVSVAGRIMSVRDMGRAGFLHIQDDTARLQLYLRQGDTENYSILKNLDIGDIVGARGHVFKTKTGEVSVYAKELVLLAKSVRPLPEKFHGLKGPELRYRKRHLDLIMNPGVKEIFFRRAKIYAQIRSFLDCRGYTEVQTPILQTQYGGASARPFKTKINAWNMHMYLRIAYELHLKRLLVGGFEKVYDLSMCFRNEGADRTHNPEFAMMEIQTAYADYNDAMKLLEELWEHVAEKVTGSAVVTYEGKKIDLRAPWKRMTMEEAIKRYGGKDIWKLADAELCKLVKSRKPAKSRGLLIAQVFEELCESKLIGPVHITDLPRETCPLARESRRDPEKIERVESYVNGWEVANSYSELIDPVVQREHLVEQARLGRGGDEEAHPMDEDYIEALESGLCPNAGIGIGIDRMVMLLTGAKSIRDVILFPIMKPKK